MGIVNVTPDSFSDGGLFLDAGAAIEHGRRLASEGAAILDIGGESTRPGSDPVPEDEELRRVLPVVEQLAGGERPHLDRHHQVGGRARGAGGRSDDRQRRLRLPLRPRAAGRGRRDGRRLLPDAHARRAAHHAGRPALRRRGLGGEVVPRGAARLRGRAGSRGGARLARPGHRLRQDRRAQPGAAAPSRRDRRHRPAGRDRHLAQELPGQARRRSRRDAPPAGHDRHQRPGARARRHGLPSARRRPERGCPAGGRCYFPAWMWEREPDDDLRRARRRRARRRARRLVTRPSR